MERCIVIGRRFLDMERTEKDMSKKKKFIEASRGEREENARS